MSLVSAADVAAAVRQTLRDHLPAQLAALPRPLPAPTSYEQVPTREAIRLVNLATLAVSVPGMSREPVQYGDGSYEATWVVNVAVFHEQSSRTPLLTAGADYAAAVRAVLLQHSSLGGLAADVRWAAESWELVGDATSDRTLGLGIAEFDVRVPDAVSTSPDTVGPQFVAEVVTVDLIPLTPPAQIPD